MKFTVACETFLRLSNAASVNDPELSLNSVRLENSAGRSFAIASNRKIMAVEYVGDTDEPDGAINIEVQPAIIGQCDNQDNIEVDYWPDFKIASMKIAGLVYPFPFLQADTFEPFKLWRNQFPSALPKVDKGFVWFETEQLNKLGLASPSGNIALPEVIDNSRRVIVRDIHDPNWIGVFLPFHPDQPNVKPATIPEWLL